MKVIFLDVDGVLHPLTGTELFVEPCMRELKRIVDVSGAQLCLSSTWRSSRSTINKVNTALQRWGIPKVAFCTPEGRRRRRCEEILSWLKAQPAVTHYTVLDDIDMSDEAQLLGHLVQPKSNVGLTGDLADLALVHLGVDSSGRAPSCSLPRICTASSERLSQTRSSPIRARKKPKRGTSSGLASIATTYADV
eukprot:GGOE01044456.1.p1 GENE.GGOE01044456.1~~GGOE01044456.1.p1  ORF type:complete len:193 (+),score=39.61 GGOE01044456.1:70-648(+)